MSGDPIPIIQKKYGVSAAVARQLLADAVHQAAEIKAFNRKREQAKSLSYSEWLHAENSDPTLRWDYPWIKYAVEHLEALIRGDIHQLIINLCPRIGKSVLTTIRLPVYWLERYPRDRVIIGAYGSDLAIGFASQSLAIYKARNPGEVDSEAQEEWSNIHGGSVKPVGVGGGVTGKGAELLLIDDPVKSFKEAHSRAYQDLVWNWWNNDLKTRRNRMDLTPTLLCMTRWSVLDLTERILNSPTAKDWTHICITALAGENDPLGRLPGESILPDRFTVESLHKYEQEDPAGFSSLFQQKPIQVALASFKTDQFKIVDEVPFDADRVRYWDRAATPGAGDWTVGVLMAVDADGYVYIEDVVRGQWAEEEVDRMMKQTAAMDWAKYGKRLLYVMQTWFEREPASSGKVVARRTGSVILAGYDVYEDRPSEHKGVRARPWASCVNRGQVRLKVGDWNQPYIAEHRKYVIGIDNGTDDQVDASSGAYEKAVLERIRVTIS